MVRAGKATALPKFSIFFNPISIRGTDYAQPLGLPHLNFFVITPLVKTDQFEQFFIRKDCTKIP